MIAAAVLLALNLVPAFSSSSRECTFPGAAYRCDAPRGGASIEWREPVAGGQHQLWLRPPSGTAVELLEFGRHVEVLWALDGRNIAITNRHGSNESSLSVVIVDAPSEVIDVESVFVRTFGKMPAVYKHGHRYFEAVSWTSPTRLRFRVRSFDAAPDEGYRATFAYDLGGTVTKER